MIVCVCKRVSDRDIERLAAQGHSLDDIAFELGVSTQCGRCRGCAESLVAEGGRRRAEVGTACLHRASALAMAA